MARAVGRTEGLGRLGATLLVAVLAAFLLGTAPPTGAQLAGAERADTLIAERIARRLAWDRELAPFDLDVRVTEAVVTLGGSVATLQESHRARRIAEGTRGVIGVVNAIRVDAALVPLTVDSPPPGDALLVERVRETLTAAPDVAAADLAVAVEEGAVHMKGRVAGVDERLRAEQLVRALNGVRAVTNDLELEVSRGTPGAASGGRP